MADPISIKDSDSRLNYELLQRYVQLLLSELLQPEESFGMFFNIIEATYEFYSCTNYFVSVTL